MKKTAKKVNSHTYHYENCKEKVRKEYIDVLGRYITIIGRHAFDWRIEVKHPMSTIFFVHTFKDRNSCLKEANNKYPKAKQD